MSRPEALTALLEDLQDEETEHPVAQHGQSAAIVYIGDKEIVLVAAECDHVFQRPANARQLFEALGNPADAAIELIDLSVGPEVLTTLEQLFTAVDER